MSLTALIRRPVVIFYETDSGTIDDAGDEVSTDHAVETVAEIQPKTTDDLTNHPDVADSDWVGYFLPDDASYLNSASSVWAEGMGTYEVRGDPFVRTNPRTQITEFIEVALKRVAGPEDSEAS